MSPHVPHVPIDTDSKPYSDRATLKDRTNSISHRVSPSRRALRRPVYSAGEPTYARHRCTSGAAKVAVHCASFTSVWPQRFPPCLLPTPPRLPALLLPLIPRRPPSPQSLDIPEPHPSAPTPRSSASSARRLLIAEPTPECGSLQPKFPRPIARALPPTAAASLRSALMRAASAWCSVKQASHARTLPYAVLALGATAEKKTKNETGS